MTYERIAYWLLPDELHIQKLQEVISLLATKYDGPIFQPHLTIAVGNYLSQSENQNILNSLMIGPCEFSLTSLGFGFEESFTKCCYLKIKEEAAIMLLSNDISNRIPKGNLFEFVPHLSLFYGELADEAKEYISMTILAPKHIRFSQLVVMGLPKINQSKSDVEKWVELGKRTLKN